MLLRANPVYGRIIRLRLWLWAKRTDSADGGSWTFNKKWRAQCWACEVWCICADSVQVRQVVGLVKSDCIDVSFVLHAHVHVHRMARSGKHFCSRNALWAAMFIDGGTYTYLLGNVASIGPQHVSYGGFHLKGVMRLMDSAAIGKLGKR